MGGGADVECRFGFGHASLRWSLAITGFGSVRFSHATASNHSGQGAGTTRARLADAAARWSRAESSGPRPQPNDPADGACRGRGAVAENQRRTAAFKYRPAAVRL